MGVSIKKEKMEQNKSEKDLLFRLFYLPFLAKGGIG